MIYITKRWSGDSPLAAGTTVIQEEFLKAAECDNMLYLLNNQVQGVIPFEHSLP